MARVHSFKLQKKDLQKNTQRWCMQKARLLVDGAVELLFPGQCLACESALGSVTDRMSFCLGCRGEMGQGDWPVCRRCAARVPLIPGEVSECAHCREHKLRFDRAFALGEYEGLLRAQALAMKTDQSERLAHAFGQLMAERLGDELRALQPDAIVPVPMHVWRRFGRGTNPPAAMAARLGRELDFPVFPKLLRLRRYTQPQKDLSYPARFRNLRGEMQVNASYLCEAPHVLLVDDILTTGATCSEAARALKKAGASEVTVLVAARTAKF